MVQADQVVDREKIVHTGHDRGHPPLYRPELVRAHERVEPDQPVGRMLQPNHFFVQKLQITPIPSVTDDEDHRPAAQHSSCPLEIEGLERLADTCPTGPITDEVAQFVQRFVHVLVAQMAGDACQSRTKDKSLNIGVLEAMRQGVNEMQEHARVAFH